MNTKALALLLFLLFANLFLYTDAFSFCFDLAGSIYGIHPDILKAIAKVESNFNPYAINYNNGSYDYGLMQINSSWYKVIGSKLWNGLADPCTNVMVGAWVLSQCIQRYGYNWEAIGCYNARSPEKRAKYAQKIYQALFGGMYEQRR